MAHRIGTQEMHLAGHTWQIYSWSDGNTIVQVQGARECTPTIERVERMNSRRKQWCIVRREPGKHRYALYPPRIHPKSFKTLEDAVTVYVMLAAAGVIKVGE